MNLFTHGQFLLIGFYGILSLFGNVPENHDN